MNFDVHTLNQVLLAGAVVLLLAILAVRLSVGIGFPSLLVYLLIGVVLGEDGFGIMFDNYDLAAALGFAALLVILAEGGLTTDWGGMRPVLGLGGFLATVGLVASILVVALFCHFVLGLTWQLSVLLGAITSSTDAAAVFSVLRRVPVPRRLTNILEAESGLNDAPVVVVVTLVSMPGASDPLEFVVMMVYELSVGVGVGLAVGFAGAWLMRRVALPASGLYPIAVMALTVLAYAGAAGLHASGFAAVYLAGVVLGNADLMHRAATRSFSEGLAWLAQIGLFVMLGLLASPSRLTFRTVLIAVLAGAVLTFVARPLSVAFSSVVQRMTWREGTFLSWAGLRGAVPIVMATIPLAEGVDGALQLFDIVFVLVIIYTLLTAPTLPKVASWLGLAHSVSSRDIEVEAAPLERIAADLLMFTVGGDSRLHGVEVGELRLPRGVSVAMIVRDGEVKVHEARTVMRHGDDLLIVTPRKQREKTERRLHAVSTRGRLATWRDPD